MPSSRTAPPHIGDSARADIANAEPNVSTELDHNWPSSNLPSQVLPFAGNRRPRWLLALACAFTVGLVLVFGRSALLMPAGANPSAQSPEHEGALARLDLGGSPSYLERGKELADRGEYQQALEYLDRAVQLGEQPLQAYFLRGRLHRFLGDHTRAIEDLTRALEYDNTYAAIYYERGDSYEAIGDNERAEADYTEYLRIRPDTLTVYRFRGLVRAYQGKYREALADYNVMLEAKPDEPLTLHSRGITRYLMGDQQGALEDYTRAAISTPFRQRCIIFWPARRPSMRSPERPRRSTACQTL